MLLSAENIPRHPFKRGRTINVSLGSGESVLLMGENGSGKTTVLKALAKKISSGTLSDSAKECDYIGAKPLILYGLTVIQQLAYYQEIFGKPSTDSTVWVDRVLNTPVYQLSQGQVQRLSLTRLAYMQSKVWLLDEPYNALDQQGIDMLNSAIDKHLDSGGGVIYSSHIVFRKGCRVQCLD
jgi:heme exporter protein A